MKAAVVGCGSIADVHIECISKMKEHEITAFVDIDIKRAEKHAEKYGKKAYSSLDEMLENEKPDIVHICTPHYLHAPMAVRCLSEGLHVFSEKPVVINRSQWNELKKAGEKVKTGNDIGARQHVGFCFQNRYHPCVQKAMEMIASGVTGKILGIRGYVTWSRDAAYYTESGWRGSLEMEGGGALINQSIHTLDLMNYIMQEKVESIDAVIANHHLKGIIEVEDAMSAYIKYKDASASFYACTSYVDNPAPIIEVLCENMRLRIEDMDLTIYSKDKKEVMTLETRQGLGKSWWGAGHEDCIGDFYRSIIENRRFMNDLDGIEDITALVLAAYESAGSGKTILF